MSTTLHTTSQGGAPKAAEGTLAGIRIIDLSSGVAGPVAANLLAEMGADVVKVEVGDGDPAAAATPFGHRTWNRSKAIVHQGHLREADVGRLLTALTGADVLVHDLADDRAAALGLDDSSLTQAFPRLVVANVTCYPRYHADADRPSSELLMLARLGALDEQEGLRPGPIFIRYPFASWNAAYLLASGVVLRLLERAQTGRGRSIRTSLLQAALVPAALYWQRAEKPPQWMTDHTLPKCDNPAHLSIFEAADGRWIHLIGGFTKTETVRRYVEEVGRPDLAGTRVMASNRDQWAEVFRGRTSEQWLTDLWNEDIPCMPVLGPGDVYGLEQARINRYAVALEDPELGDTVQAGYPIEVTPPASVRTGPASIATLGDLADQWGEHPAAGGHTAPSANPRRSLAGVRVVDFGAYVAGPLAAQCFADHGADVIKVEPVVGEKGRNINQFTGCQHGKRALAIDLRDPASKPVLERLLSWADVVTHNVRRDSARRLGIDDDAIRRVNPDAVIAVSSSYGRDGSWAAFPAFDPTALALSGVEEMISGPGRRPSYLRNSSMDVQCGLALFTAALVGLYRRETIGGGSRVGTSLLAVAAMASSETMLVDGAAQPLPDVDTDQRGTSWSTGIYEAATGWVAVDARSDEQRLAFLAAVGCDHPNAIGDAIASCPVEEIWHRLERAGVPSEIVAVDGRDAFFDRELSNASGLVTRTAQSPYGWLEGPDGYWSDRDGTIGHGDGLPRLGQHSVEVLTGLGFSSPEIETLIEAGVVVADASATRDKESSDA